MATQHLDLDEQQQIADLKYFWKRYGRWIATVTAICLTAYVAWTGWGIWQSNLEKKSAIQFDEITNAAAAKDVAKVNAVFTDMKEQFGATSYTAQAALLVARINYEKGEIDTTKAILQWLVSSRAESAYRDIARLRLAGVMIEAKQYDQAITLLKTDISPAFVALAADRMGDAYSLQNKSEEAKAQYLKAHAGLPVDDPYRKMIDVKLARMGVATKDAP